jgi:hypothetical protein
MVVTSGNKASNIISQRAALTSTVPVVGAYDNAAFTNATNRTVRRCGWGCNILDAPRPTLSSRATVVKDDATIKLAPSEACGKTGGKGSVGMVNGDGGGGNGTTAGEAVARVQSFSRGESSCDRIGDDDGDGDRESGRPIGTSVEALRGRNVVDTPLAATDPLPQATADNLVPCPNSVHASGCVVMLSKIAVMACRPCWSDSAGHVCFRTRKAVE